MNVEYKCRYCAAIFEKKSDRGLCPNCGAPEPAPYKLPVEIKIVYVERPASIRSDYKPYYIPESPSPKAWLYSTFGFRIASVLLIVVAIALFLLFVGALRIGLPGALNSEELRQTAPTAVIIATLEPTPTAAQEDLLKEVNGWYSPSESMALREQENVVNLIVLDPDEVKVASSQTVQLDETWNQERPFFVEAVSVVEDTAVIVQIGGKQYHINAYMPFISKSVPTILVMVDHEGTLWTLSADKAILINASEVDLPVTINPNSSLEIAFSKQ